MKMHCRKRNLINTRTFVYDILESRKVLATIADFNLDFPTGDISAEIVGQNLLNSASAETSIVSSGENGTDQSVVETDQSINRSEGKTIDGKSGSHGPALMMDARITNVNLYYKGSGFSTGPNGFVDAIDSSRLFAVETQSEQILDQRYLSNYEKGINALLFDVELLASANLTASDFRFQWSPQGNFDVNAPQNEPQSWEDVPFSPNSIGVESLSATMTRVQLNWLDNQIQNRWLRMTIKATASTGLAQDEVYYHGHLMGDLSPHKPSSDSGQPYGRFHVDNLSDVNLLRRSLGDFVDVANRMDVNKNSFIEVLDLQVVRSNLNKALSNIKIVRAASQRSQGASVDQVEASTVSETDGQVIELPKTITSQVASLSTWHSVASERNGCDAVVAVVSDVPTTTPEIRDMSIVDAVFSKHGSQSFPFPSLVDDSSETNQVENVSSASLNLDLSVLA